MSEASRIASVHTLNPPSDLIELSREACGQAGFDYDWSERKLTDATYATTIDSGNATIYLVFDPVDDIKNHSSFFVNFAEHLRPYNWEEDEQYREFLDASIELLCRLFNLSNAEYVSLFTDSDYNTTVPSDLPLADQIDKVPRIGIYSESLLQDFGGLAGLFKEPRWEYSQPPWRVGELDNGSLLVITHPRPWTDGGWTESSYVDLRPGEEYV